MEHSTFTPLVLSTTGGMGRAATTIYRRLAAMLSEKRDVPYSKMLDGFAAAVRGARSSANRPANGALHVPVELQSAEGQLLTL